MDMFDFFFPEQAEAAHLRRISSTLARSSTTSGAATVAARQAVDEVASLKSDVRFLSMVVMAVVKRLTEEKSMNLADVADLLDEIDALDGVSDGGLDPGVLRGLLGVIKHQPSEETEPSDEIRIVTTPRYRRRR